MNLDYYKQPEAFFNIMWLSNDPVQCAQWHCDMHLSKGLLWAAQILSQVWFNYSLPKREDIESVLLLEWMLGSEQVPYGMSEWRNAQLCGQRIYFPGHNGHPCIVWAGRSGGNYISLYRLACALLDEYEFRFKRWHATLPVLRVLELLPPPLVDSSHLSCPIGIVLPDEFTDYVSYYKSLGKHICKYTNRERPAWLS